MKCKLCQKDKELLSKSHIIHNFMYKELYDKNHRIIKFTTLTPNSEQKIQTGDYESNILCKKCDNEIIGSLENYASKVLFGGKINVETKSYKKPDGLEFIQISNIDYKKFKLFLLSILWRASISSRPFFNKVNLGTYEEEIRKMILEQDPKNTGDFPCIVTSTRKHNLPKEIIAEPRKIKLNDINKVGYSFFVGGFLYIFRITKNDTTDWVLEAAINPSNEMKLMHSTKEQARNLLKSYFGVNFEDHPDYN